MTTSTVTKGDKSEATKRKEKHTHVDGIAKYRGVIHPLSCQTSVPWNAPTRKTKDWILADLPFISDAMISRKLRKSITYTLVNKEITIITE